jgi:hypothetical protein
MAALTPATPLWYVRLEGSPNDIAALSGTSPTLDSHLTRLTASSLSRHRNLKLVPLATPVL